MSTELVLVPLWKRAGFARACLLRLAAAHNHYLAHTGSQVYFRLLLDEGHTQDVERVALDFARSVPAVEIVRRRFRQGRGNSGNLLMGLREAAAEGWDRTHIVEEDVFVSDGYFSFHDQAHRMAPEAFAVSACRNQNAENVDLGPGGLWRHASYQSLGVSLGPDSVRAVVPHVRDEYFKDMVGYCRRYFPKSVIPAPHAEQDGLLNRVRERTGMYTVYPSVPRAYHAGFAGYNRPGNTVLSGTAHEQAMTLLAYSSADLNAMAAPEFQDIEVSPLDFVADLAVIL